MWNGPVQRPSEDADQKHGSRVWVGTIHIDPGVAQNQTGGANRGVFMFPLTRATHFGNSVFVFEPQNHPVPDVGSRPQSSRGPEGHGDRSRLVVGSGQTSAWVI